MKKYYIPTSSLNFNNILSSESVSPNAFYQARAFGYRRWTTIPENPFNNSIVLYDQPYLFTRPVSDYEDHPMLLEVILNESIEATLVALDKHIYICDHTIYLDPYSSNIFFFSERDKRITLSLSDSSIETKFTNLYRNNIAVIASSTMSSFPIIKVTAEQQELNITAIEKDKHINRMKGLLYGYYIGAILSTSKENVIKLNKAREINNILAAILSSFDHCATIQQKNKLKSLYSNFQTEVPFLSKLSEIISEKSMFDAIVSLIRKEYGYIRGEIDVDRIISQLLITPTAPDAKNPVIENVNSTIRQIENSITKNAHLISVNESQVVVIDSALTHINIEEMSEQDKTLCKAWLNEVLSKDEYNGKTSTFKDVLSDDITIKAKELCEGEWKGSYAEITLNALRRHVRGDEFPHEWNNDIYSSIAAVIVRGDDWQKLLKYMQGKVMTDYRIAFAMYGTLNGFANLSRDFTDILFEQTNTYVDEVYKEFYGQLNGFDIPVIKSDINEKITTIQPASANLNDNSVFNEILNFFESTEFQKGLRNKNQLRISLRQCIDKHKPFVDVYNFIHDLNYYDGWGKGKKNKQWEKMQMRFCPDYKKNNHKKNKTQQDKTPSFFDNSDMNIEKESTNKIGTAPVFVNHSQLHGTNGKSIIYDDNAKNIIRNFSLLGTNANYVIDMFIDFQKNYRSGFYSQNPTIYKPNNSDVIDHFCKWCLSPKNPKSLPKENSRMFDELKKYLLKYYYD